MSLRDRFGSPATTRVLALASIAGLLGASLQVLYHFIDVTGVPETFLLVVAATMVAATVLSRLLKPWMAVALGVVLLAAGLAWYLEQIAGSPPLSSLVGDALALFYGRSLLHITGIRAWVLGIAPAPVFLAWYFAMRRRYVPAVLVAGGTLAFFVLTTDADAITTLSGVVAGTAALALGDMDRRGEPAGRADTVLAIVAVMIVVPAVVSVVPAGAGASVSITEELLGEGSSLETSLMTDERVDVEGSITLSPRVRFSVRSDREDYWRVASYDRYTGDGWVRTGSPDPSDGRLGAPVGPTRTVHQTFRAETAIQRTPAAWKPVEVTGFEGELRESADGSIQPAGALEAGEAYNVRSLVPAATPRQLQNASTDYPAELAEDYTQLPSSTPDRLAERTATLTANAETPYETARTIERWLANNRAYSLSVREPRGNVADAFLFEMDRGYCVYFATTMVAMLRSQDVPARFVTGYTSGERVGEDEWVVRGLNSHAWVEAYFPGSGWHRFDPTPAVPRAATRVRTVTEARQRNASGVDTAETREQIGSREWPSLAPGGQPLTEVPTDNASGPGVSAEGVPVGPGLLPGSNPGGTETATPGPGSGADGPWPRLPTRQQFTLAVVAVAGVAAGMRRTDAAGRAYRAVWLRYQPRSEPAADVERAFQRVLYAVERRADRARSPDETVRAYFDAVDADPTARRVAAIRERVRYAGRVTEADGDEAVRLANELVR